MRRVAATLVVLGAAAAAEAGQITVSGTSVGGREVSAQLEWSYDGSGCLELWLRNLTALDQTRAASELLTGVSFEIDGIMSGSSLAIASAAQTYRISDVNGAIVATDGATSVGLGSEWGFSHLPSGAFDLTWNPGTGPDYGIVGVYDDDATKEWTSANAGFAQGNHSPVVYEEAYFKLTNPSFTDLSLKNVVFFFNTDHTPINPVPLPPAAWMGLGLLGVLGVTRARRRRRGF